MLNPLPISEKVWEDISLDLFCWAPFLPKLHCNSRNGESLVQGGTLCQSHIFICKNGLQTPLNPRSVASDRDPIFLSHLWQEFFFLNGTKLRMTTACHPQSYGQTETMNKAMQQYLRCFVHEEPRRWGKSLHWVLWHYNTTIHFATVFSPFASLSQ